jgi:succinylglutamic semialdehyde dehydrogenase
MTFQPVRSAFDFIAGQLVAPDVPDGRLTIQSPADIDLTVATVDTALAHVDRAVEAAAAAFKPWRRTPYAERVACLRRYQSQLRVHQESIAQTLSTEVGKPLWEARTEVASMIAKVDLSLGPGAQYTDTERVDALPGEIRYRPLGVVAVIGPFNFPGHLPNGQIIPSLLLGNTVVHKPSEKTPSAAVWIARCMEEAGLPAGVLNVVQGGPDAARALTTHDIVNAIAFTGSAAVGARIVQ